MTRIPFIKTIALVGCLLGGCGPSEKTSGITVTQIEALEAFDSLLPVDADSVIQLYMQNDPAKFKATYRRRLEDAGIYIDSLNSALGVVPGIDTLAIDHAFENFGNAACSGRTIYLSSSYFLLYNDPSIIRSVITHEFGHKIYERLSESERLGFEDLWMQLGNSALLYLFRDGEYSGNAKFGGHPYDSPAEFFASAFNLFSNCERELTSRVQYVTPNHLQLIERLKRNILNVAKKQ